MLHVYAMHEGPQLGVFNSQSKMEIGSVRDASSRRLMRTFHGTIVGMFIEAYKRT